MATDYYTDKVLGEWKFKKRTKSALIYERKCEVFLNKAHAMYHNDGKEECNIHGKIILRQEKKIDIQTGTESMFKYVDLTDKTEKEKLIK